jgi:hypothetical protein
MPKKPLGRVFALAVVTAGFAFGGNATALMVGAGEPVVVGELTARGNVRVAQEGTRLQLNVSGTRYAFFSGDGVAVGTGAHAVLDLETGASLMFPERTLGAVGMDDGRIATVLEAGFLCFGVPQRDAEMVIVSGPYTFSIEDAGSGLMSIVDDAVQLSVRGGFVAVRGPGGELMAYLGPGEGRGFSIADPGATVPPAELGDPCTRKGFAWHGPQAPALVGPPLPPGMVPVVAVPPPPMLPPGIGVVGVAGGLAGAAFVGAAFSSSSSEDLPPQPPPPVSP